MKCHLANIIATCELVNGIDNYRYSLVTRPILQVAEPLFPDRSEALHVIVSRQRVGVERSLTSNWFTSVRFT